MEIETVINLQQMQLLKAKNLSGVFQRPTRTYQTYRATPPTFVIWNNLCDLVYQRPTRSYRSRTAVT